MASDIEHIELGVAAPVIRTIGEPREEKVNPVSSYHARFSGPYTVATAFIGGGGLGIYLDDFDESHWNNPTILDLAAKVSVVVDTQANTIFPHAFAANMTILTKDGKTYSHRVDASKGSSRKPLTHTQLLQKFSLNASRLLNEKDVTSISQLIEFSNTNDFFDMMKLVSIKSI